MNKVTFGESLRERLAASLARLAHAPLEARAL